MIKPQKNLLISNTNELNSLRHLFSIYSSDFAAAAGLCACLCGTAAQAADRVDGEDVEQVAGCLGSLCGAAAEGLNGEEVAGCLGGLCQNLCGAICQAAGVDGGGAEQAMKCLG